MQESLDEMARRHDELIEKGTDLGNLVPVEARVKKPVDTVYSTRFSQDEIALIRTAAAKSGMTAGAFIRAASLAAAAQGLDIGAAERAGQWSEIQRMAQRLNQAVHQMTEPSPQAPARRRAAARR